LIEAEPEGEQYAGEWIEEGHRRFLFTTTALQAV